MRVAGALCTIFGGSAALVLAAAWPAIATSQQPRIDPNASYPCCDTQSGEIVGSMTIMACAQRGAGHVPKIPGAPGSENLCAQPQGGGGGSGGGASAGGMGAPPREPEDEPVWDEYRDNIPNGSFEQWNGDKPVGFGSYRRDESVRNVPPELRNFETVSRSNESFEGSAAIEIKNFHLDVRSRLQGRPIPPQVRQMLENLALPGGAISCTDNCPLGTTRGGNSRDLRVPIEGDGPAICGAYRDNLRGGDRLFASVALFAGGEQPIAGGTAFDIRSARRSRDRDGWIKFRIPIDQLPGQARREPTEATIQFQIVGGSLAPTAGGPQLNKDSRVVIDAVHFCGGVDLRLTDAQVAGGFLVPERQEEEKGGIAFLNHDNDDGDKLFDHEDTKGVEGGDNELAQLLLQIPNNYRGTVTLRQTAGQDKVKLWTADTKRDFEEYTDLGNPLELPANFTDNGAFYEKVLWIEGVAPSADMADIAFEMTYRPEGGGAVEEDTDTVKLSVLAVEDMRWLGKENNSEFDDNELTRDPNHPLNDGVKDTRPDPDNVYDRAVRVFPGRRYIGGQPSAAARNYVELEVELNIAPPRPVSLYLRAFDVDDPSADDDEVDSEEEAEDNRGTKPGKAGMFTSSNGEIAELEFREQKAKAEFRVTMQPGDNFRVAAFPDRKYLEKLENDDARLSESWAEAARIVDGDMLAAGVKPADAEFPEAKKWLSDTLTVWRFLHVELDSMRQVRNQVLEGTAGTVTRESRSYAGETVSAYKVPLGFNIASRLSASARNNDGVEDMFVPGRYIFGETSWQIIGNTGYASADDYAYLYIADAFWERNGVEPAEAAALISGKSFKLEDDDFREIPIVGNSLKAGPFTDGSPVPLPPTDRLEPSDDNPFFPAYVFPRIDTLPKGPGTVEFSTNLYDDSDLKWLREYFSQFDAAAQDHDETLWTVYLLGAYQGVRWEDADPAGDGAVAGEADGEKGTGGLIYWASGAELERSNGGAEGWRLIDAVPHELGHLFGGDHGDEGLMSDGVDGHPPPTADFSPTTLDKIRSATHP